MVFDELTLAVIRESPRSSNASKIAAPGCNQFTRSAKRFHVFMYLCGLNLAKTRLMNVSDNSP